ncbi:MAG: hypothetical protein Q9188_003343 [Gyalolechia gomerana]
MTSLHYHSQHHILNPQSWLPHCPNPALFLPLQLSNMPSTSPNAPVLQGEHAPRPDPQALTSNLDLSQIAPTNVDHTPHPESSLNVAPEREAIVKAITNL